MMLKQVRMARIGIEHFGPGELKPAFGTARLGEAAQVVAAQRALDLVGDAGPVDGGGGWRWRGRGFGGGFAHDPLFLGKANFWPLSRTTINSSAILSCESNTILLPWVA